MLLNPPIGILGGTFDPIHYGHLRIALEIYEKCQLNHVRFIPCRIPLLKNPAQATTAQRIEMLTAALKNTPAFCLDTREIDRDTPSYMVDTLHALQQDFPHTPLCLILGSDTLMRLHHWYEFERLFEYAHLIIVNRTHHPLAGDDYPVMPLINARTVTAVATLHTRLAGSCLIQPVTALDISSTALREQIKAGLSARYLLPEPTWDYIQQHQLYQHF